MEKGRRLKIALSLALAAAFAVFFLVAPQSPGGRDEKVAEAPALLAGAAPSDSPRPVTVLPSSPSSARPQIRSRGEARARYRTTLSAEVAGTLVSISEQAHSGRRVTRGSVLMTLDDSRYLEAVASARAELERARLLDEEEELRARQAEADWRRLEEPGEPSSFLLRQPQRRSARMGIEAAEAALLEAEKNLARTVIRAPFNAAVVRRMAPLGSSLQPGAELLELDSSDAVEIRVPLTSADWALLPPEAELLAEGWPVELLAGGPEPRRWQGRVSRIERHVTAETRQRALVATVLNPLEQTPPLYPGTFVRAALPGRELEGVLDLPSHAVTERGEIWFVDAQGLLAKAAVHPHPGRDGRVLIQAPAEMQGEKLDVVAHPMASHLPGLPVTKEVAHDDARH
ncbi:MAG: efflux RND transporter periplasmic adaptor subunit [Acidobacteriota bacterium]